MMSVPRKSHLGTGLWLSLILACGPIAAAEVPNAISYQGRLANASGLPITATTTIRFVLLRGGDASTNPSTGVPVYREDMAMTPDANGVFSHLIGTGTASGLCDENGDNTPSEPCTLSASDAPDGNTPLFLEVRIDPSGVDNVLLPRQRMASVPYAMRAATLNGIPAGNVAGAIPVSNGTLNPGLNADKVDGLDAGNASGQVAVSNGTLNVNLNADKVDGFHAGNGSGQIAVNNGILNASLDADLLDGLHANEIIDAASGAVCLASKVPENNNDGTSGPAFTCPGQSFVLAIHGQCECADGSSAAGNLFAKTTLTNVRFPAANRVTWGTLQVVTISGCTSGAASCGVMIQCCQ